MADQMQVRMAVMIADNIVHSETVHAAAEFLGVFADPLKDPFQLPMILCKKDRDLACFS